MRRTFFIAAGFALAVGCGSSDRPSDPMESDPEEEDVFIPPPPPPKEGRDHGPSGARLVKPEPSWQFTDGRAGGDQNAVLGLERDKDCIGWVSVQRGEGGPRAYADAVLAARQAGAKWEVAVDEDVLYVSHTARRWEIKRSIEGVVYAERASFLVEGPRVFGLHAVARGGDYLRRRRCLDAVTAAFDLGMPKER